MSARPEKIPNGSLATQKPQLIQGSIPTVVFIAPIVETLTSSLKHDTIDAPDMFVPASAGQASCIKTSKSHWSPSTPSTTT